MVARWIQPPSPENTMPPGPRTISHLTRTWLHRLRGRNGQGSPQASGRRAALTRVSLQVPLAGGLLGIPYAALAGVPVWTAMVGLPLQLAALVALSRQRPNLALHSTLAGVTSQLTLLSALTGGIAAPSAWFLALVPALTLYAHDRAAAWFWGATSAMAIAGLAWADLSAGTTPNDLSAHLLGLASLASLQTSLVAHTLQLSERSAEGVASMNARLIAASESRNAFLTNMTHELRTPLNGVLGMTDILLSEPLPPSQRATVEVIRTAGEQLLREVSNILEMTRMESLDVPLQRVPFDLEETMAQVVDLFADAAAHRGLTLEVQLEPDVPQLVGDHRRVRQLLYHLVANGVQFTEQGGVTLRGRWHPSGRSGQLTLQVVDTGPGIPRDQHQRIFAPFTQVDDSNARRVGGAGIGLSICRSVVTALGGDLELDSEAGRGSTFTVRLPMARAEVGDDEAEEAPKDGPIILVVEDDPGNQRVTRMLLERLGCRVSVAGTGREALARLEHTDPAAILMDCQLPGMSGYETTRRIRRLSAAGASVPIIAVTADESESSRQHARRAGMSDYVTKPVTLEGLREVVDAWARAAHLVS